jgi:aminoglycoside phosphotransferase (APT) family kinase protein
VAIPKQRDPEVTRQALTEWLAQRLPDASDLKVSDVETPSQGFSNETAYFEATWSECGQPRTESLVARIQPLGYQLFLDADVLLQWRMMEAVTAASDVPVPPLFFAESDPSVLGAPFFVMGKVNGRVPQQLPPYHATGWLVDDLSAPQREQLWFNGVDALAAIHRLDWRAHFGFLDTPGRGETGLDRDLSRLEDWYEWAAKGRAFSLAGSAMRYLREHQPTKPSLGVTWGDACLGNVMYAADLSVAAVLDWEMATVGPGEADLGWWLFMDDMYCGGFNLPRLEGIPESAATIAHYQSSVGRPVDDIDYYRILAGMRMAVVTIRSVDLQVEMGVLAPETTMYTRGPVAIELSRLLGLPIPELSPEMAAMAAALTNTD